MTDYEYAAFTGNGVMVGVGPKSEEDEKRTDSVHQDVIDWNNDGYPDVHMRRRVVGAWEPVPSDLAWEPVPNDLPPPEEPKRIRVKEDIGGPYPHYDEVTLLLHPDGSVTWDPQDSPVFHPRSQA